MRRRRAADARRRRHARSRRQGADYRWFFYPEAGTGIPGQPVVSAGLAPVGGGGTPAKAAFRPGPKAARASRRRG